MLSHASTTITLNTYSHVLTNMQDSAAEAMEAVLSEGQPHSGCSKRSGKRFPAISPCPQNTAVCR